MDGDANQASLAFALGMQLCLCTNGIEGTLDDRPAFAGQVAKLAALRKKTAPRTTAARFRDTIGLKVKADNGAVAYVFDSPAGPAVTLAAPRGIAKVKVVVDRDRFAARGTATGRLHQLDGSTREIVGDSLELDLPANGTAVWEL